MFIFVLAALCSYEDSQEVRTFLSTSFASLLSRHNLKSFTLPLDCPFAVSEKSDVFYSSYPLKSKQSVTYECSECKKSFRTESAIELHVQNKHSSTGTCFADFCAFLPCGRDDEIIQNRCENIMAHCFHEETLKDALSLCKFSEESIWEMKINRAGYIVYYIIQGVLCFIYYLLVWTDVEETKIIHKKKHR